MATAIRTPDQRLRVFISSSLKEVADERKAARAAVEALHLTPVMFELGARPHPPRDLYRAYLKQSDIFVGIYWESYGWIAPDMSISGLEDEFSLAGSLPRLIYLKEPAPERQPTLGRFLQRVQDSNVSYKSFKSDEELKSLLQDDLAIMLTERFVSAGHAPVHYEEEAADPLPIIPRDTSALVGRSDEIAAVSALLLDSEARLITLTGPGGIGKTRLANEVAREVQDSFRDGVRYVSLAATRDAELVPMNIAQALGVREEENRPIIDVLRERMSRIEALIVLDNFEQVIDAAPMLADLLAGAPTVKLLVTSRAVLNVRAEREFAVPPLEVPEGEVTAVVAERSAAVRLFVERARLSKPDFRLDASNAMTIAAICRRLDGLPLAIELAAARVKILSPEALLARLGSRLKLLTTGPRDLPARQQTLRQAIDWSYELLDEPEKLLFRRLSVFFGGGSLEAVEEVCNPDGKLGFLDLVSSLIDKNLVRQVSGFGGELRISMLGTLDEYATERLEESGEHTEFLALHAGYFLELSEAAREELRGPNQGEWLERLDIEYGNLRIALSWTAEQKDPDPFFGMFYSMWRYWSVRGHLLEGATWAERAVALVDNGTPKAAARALYAAGEIAHARGDIEQAEPCWQRALQITREADDPEGIATMLRVLGNAAFETGQIDESAVLYEQALETFKSIDDEYGIGQCMNNLGRVAGVRKQWDRSLEYLRESARIFARVGHQQGVARALLNLGVTHREAGQLEEASTRIRESTRMWRELGGVWDLVDCLEDWAATEALKGNDVSAAQSFGTSEAYRESMGAPLAPFEAEILQPYWDQVRERLGVEPFRRAWEEGRAMAMHEAVERILSGSG